MGYLLNADVTILANFTNLNNKKVSVEFRSIAIHLLYHNIPIASRSIDPFSIGPNEDKSRLKDVHMVSSQVALPSRDSIRLQKQMQNNRIKLEIFGLFHARSKLGSLLEYGYKLYGHCTVVVTDPPSGVLVARSCRTKR